MEAEFFAKLSIVVEEAALVPQSLLPERPPLQKEATGVLAIVATARKNTFR